MKHIFLNIQNRLASKVPTLQYIDRNWNQLRYDQAPIKWPCALIDLDSIDYSQAADCVRIAEASISIIIADQVLTRSSMHAPSKNNAYDILDILSAVIEALEGYRIPDTTQALSRTHLEHSYSDKGHDIYTLTFTTAWIEQPNEEGQTVMASPSINVRLKLPD